MEVYIYNSNFEITGVVDTFMSLIWTDRYYGRGDFELVHSPTTKFINLLQTGVFLGIKESEHMMVIDHKTISTDIENGNKITIKGSSLEYLLDRRIVWNSVVLNGNFQDGILRLLNENAINPSIVERKLNRLQFEASVDPAITALTANSQFMGNSLYKVIFDLCISRKIGFKMTLNSLGKIVFKLYSGVDRSYDQISRPYVVFSPNYDNLINGQYILSIQRLKTVTLVAGEEGVGNIRRQVIVNCPEGAGTDIERRELYTDSKDVNRTVDNITLTDAEYDAQLAQRGFEDLSNNTTIESFEGQVDTTMNSYGEDFSMGDILQVSDQYGHDAKSRVIELIYSEDDSGITIVPTFNAP